MGDHIAKLILRIMVGGLMLFHGIHKAVNGIGFIKGMLKSQGIPEMLSYGVYVGEILAPLFLIIGWRSRLWAAVIALNMAVVLYLAHAGALLKLGAHGAWAVELPMFYLLSAVAIVLLGSGKYAVIRD
ncbi:DoxX family protein [Sulfurovum sp.]|jgi:putative oxidoreductase|uniref:DoxX family protein n=1 Tax=Sulfurovum sp. TaxID=1969726 RepID=UPI002A370028|nr:DoxX family protein [Sulfurovum sp.]MDD2450412.1 DoxX family protein [Sulfurovum sp.]MDD3498856.1 DoxX family protein [Sulfurovum sp.]MDY0403317.1 DoxX family protein [Sulfurovum sp.]